MSIAGQPVDASNISNLRDILSTYNKLTETCFNHCVANLNYRDLTDGEEKCVNSCSAKLINANQRIMSIFMEMQSKRQQAQIDEYQKQQEEMAKTAQASSAETAQASLGTEDDMAKTAQASSGTEDAPK